MVLFIYSLIKEHFVPEIVPLWHTKIGISVFIWEGLHERGSYME